MANRVLFKLLPPPQSIKILQCKADTILPKTYFEENWTSSYISNPQKHTSHNQDSNILTRKLNGSLNRNCPMCSPYLCTRFTRYNIRNIHSDLTSLTKCNYSLGVKPFEFRYAFMHVDSVKKSLLSTTCDKATVWNKKLTIFKGNLYQGRIQLYAQQSEVQPVVSEGIGWAGQPIVRRTHAILPEVCGDVSDVFTAFDKLQSSQNSENDREISGKTLQVQDGDRVELESSECSHQAFNPKFGSYRDHESIQSCIKSHDNISLMNSNNNLYFTVNDPKEAGKPKNVMKKLKLKKKKKTKVISAKNVKGLNKVKMVRKKKTKVFGPKIKHNPQPQLALCQRNNTKCNNSENIIFLENRQLMTNTALRYPRTSTDVSKNKHNISKKKNIRKKKIKLDDCICPETILFKQKQTTKVCGEAAGGGEKKEKKKRKIKMCLIEPIVKYRKKTFVCASAAQVKGKRKRQLPKCPKPEKKVAPRVVVCPPQLYDEAKAAAEKCVKQVEEVKVRKRTKVCKPIIIYAKEEASIKIEKKVCTESRVKKTISRQTKVCPPQNGKFAKSKKKWN